MRTPGNPLMLAIRQSATKCVQHTRTHNCVDVCCSCQANRPIEGYTIVNIKWLAVLVRLTPFCTPRKKATIFARLTKECFYFSRQLKLGINQSKWPKLWGRSTENGSNEKLSTFSVGREGNWDNDRCNWRISNNTAKKSCWKQTKPAQIDCGCVVHESAKWARRKLYVLSRIESAEFSGGRGFVGMVLHFRDNRN